MPPICASGAYCGGPDSTCIANPTDCGREGKACCIVSTPSSELTILIRLGTSQPGMCMCKCSVAAACSRYCCTACAVVIQACCGVPSALPLLVDYLQHGAPCLPLDYRPHCLLPSPRSLCSNNHVVPPGRPVVRLRIRRPRAVPALPPAGARGAAVAVRPPHGRGLLVAQRKLMRTGKAQTCSIGYAGQAILPDGFRQLELPRLSGSHAIHFVV